MAKISGVGAKKLERYGDDFLSVIAGEAEAMHPSRRKLAGSESGVLYDRLAEAARDLYRGIDGYAKPLSLTPGQIKQIAERRPSSEDDLARIKGMDTARIDRFGSAFLSLIHERF